MKKIVYVFLLLSSICSAQNTTPPKNTPSYVKAPSWHDSVTAKTFFLGINAGFSVPVSDYGDKNSRQSFMIDPYDTTQAKGFANVGLHVDANGGVYLNPYFGIIAKISYNMNSFNNNDLATILKGNYYTINNNYAIWQYMAGFFGNIQAAKTSSLWVQVMAGHINANFPSFTLSSYTVNPNGTTTQLTIDGRLTNAIGFAYSAGIGAKKEITKTMSFLIMLTYSGAQLNYRTFTFGPAGSAISYTQYTPITMSYGDIDVSAGLQFHF